MGESRPSSRPSNDRDGIAPTDARRCTRTDRITIAFVVAAVFAAVVYTVFFFPGIGSGPVAARSTCKNNLQQILLALDNYHKDHGFYPSAYIADENGRPIHSWRVRLLPYLDQARPYNRYRFVEPWDGSHNRQFADVALPVFCCPSDMDWDSGTTNYVAVIDPNTCRTGDKPVSKQDIGDPLDQTVLLVEVADSGIHWSKPRDFFIYPIPLEIDPQYGIGISGRHKSPGDHLAFCNGWVTNVKRDLPPETLRRLLQRNDCEPVDDLTD